MRHTVDEHRALRGKLFSKIHFDASDTWVDISNPPCRSRDAIYFERGITKNKEKVTCKKCLRWIRETLSRQTKVG